MKLDFTKNKNKAQTPPEVRRSNKSTQLYIKKINTNQQKMRWSNYSFCR